MCISKSFFQIPNIRASYNIQQTKILLVLPKCEIIFGTLLICTFFQYCDSKIGLFFIAPHLAIALAIVQYQNFSLKNSLFFLVSDLYIDLWLLFCIALGVVIVLPTTAIARVVTLFCSLGDSEK